MEVDLEEEVSVALAEAEVLVGEEEAVSGEEGLEAEEQGANGKISEKRMDTKNTKGVV